MTNINPDKLIKGEPYLIEIEDKETGKRNTAVGFFNEYVEPPEPFSKRLYFYNHLEEKLLTRYEQRKKFFALHEIKSITHLKRGLKLGDCSVCEGKPQDIMSCPCGKDIPKQEVPKIKYCDHITRGATVPCGNYFRTNDCFRHLCDSCQELSDIEYETKYGAR